MNHKITLVTAVAAVLVVSVSCGQNTQTPTAPSLPSAPSPSVGAVTGLLRGEAPPPTRIARPHPVLPNATVTVIGGPASGIATTTREDGTYELRAAGTFKLRFDHPQFVTIETAETVMTPAGVTMSEVTMLTAPWTLTGSVVDSLGNPIAEAEVIVSSNSFFSTYPSVRTDATGHFVFRSTEPHFANLVIVARRAGYEPMREVLIKCCGAIDDLRLVRVVSITPTAPASMRVGELIEIPASVVVFDNGITRNIFVLPTSSTTAVVNVRRSTHWYEMQGLRPGVATLTFDLWGAVATMEVQVR